MERGILRISVLVIVSWVAAAIAAHACSCTIFDDRPCNGANYPVIFAGKVTSVTRTSGALQAHFKVLGQYKGSVGAETTVYTSAYGASCGYGFHEGETYIVYTGPDNNGGLFVHLCGSTHPFAQSRRGELEFLDDLSTAEKIGSIYGWLYDGTSFKDRGPLKGIKVVASDGHREYSARTDRKGRFEIKDVPEGEYRVSPGLPPELALSRFSRERVSVVPQACAFADLRTENSATIEGRIAGPAGQRVEHVPVAAVGPTTAGTWSEADGKYVLRGMEPGEYVVGVNIGYHVPDTKNPYIHTYYPATSEQATASIIKIGRGTHVSGIDIPLPPPLPVQNIAITAVNEDGTPAGVVPFVRRYRGYTVLVTDVQTDSTGHARAEFLRGITYDMQGHTRERCTHMSRLGPTSFRVSCASF